MSDTGNVWPQDLIHRRGAPVDSEQIAAARAKAEELIGADHDVVAMFDGYRGLAYAVYIRYHDDVWSLVDTETEDENRTYTSADIGVLVLRDYFTEMVPLRFADAQPTSRDALSVTPHGSIAVVIDPSGSKTIAIHSHGYWLVNGESFTDGELFTFNGQILLLWIAPGKPTPSSKRRDYETHDEVRFEGRQAYIVAKCRHEQDSYAVFTPEDYVTSEPVSYENLEYVSSPTRPLSEDDARARGLTGPELACSRCGDHGAETLPYAYAAKANPRFVACREHLKAVADEVKRFETTMERLVAFDFDWDGTPINQGGNR